MNEEFLGKINESQIGRKREEENFSLKSAEI